jgi:hypothetical protein
MDSAKKKKWLGIAQRYSGMTPAEQHRAQLQMRDWFSLTPEQRELVREKYKTIKKLPPEKRHEIKQKWREYEQASEDHRGNSR